MSLFQSIKVICVIGDVGLYFRISFFIYFVFWGVKFIWWGRKLSILLQLSSLWYLISVSMIICDLKGYLLNPYPSVPAYFQHALLQMYHKAYLQAPLWVHHGASPECEPVLIHLHCCRDKWWGVSERWCFRIGGGKGESYGEGSGVGGVGTGDAQLHQM